MSRWWSYIDARDGAQAVVRALEYDKPGFDNFIVASADTVMSRPSKELMADLFPGTKFRAPVEGPSHSAPARRPAVFSAGSLSTHGETTHRHDSGCKVGSCSPARAVRPEA